MMKFSFYRCSVCGKEYTPDEVTYTCPLDGGNLDIFFDYDLLRKKISPDLITSSQEASIWRYLPLLPVDDPGYIGSAIHSVGWTPLYSPDRRTRNHELSSRR